MARPCPRPPTRPGLAVSDRPAHSAKNGSAMRVYRTCKTPKVGVRVWQITSGAGGHPGGDRRSVLMSLMLQVANTGARPAKGAFLWRPSCRAIASSVTSRAWM